MPSINKNNDDSSRWFNVFVWFRLCSGKRMTRYWEYFRRHRERQTHTTNQSKMSLLAASLRHHIPHYFVTEIFRVFGWFETQNVCGFNRGNKCKECIRQERSIRSMSFHCSILLFLIIILIKNNNVVAQIINGCVKSHNKHTIFKEY